jgi:hypothetical protein
MSVAATKIHRQRGYMSGPLHSRAQLLHSPPLSRVVLNQSLLVQREGESDGRILRLEEPALTIGLLPSTVRGMHISLLQFNPSSWLMDCSHLQLTGCLAGGPIYKIAGRPASNCSTQSLDGRTKHVLDTVLEPLAITGITYSITRLFGSKCRV